MMKKTCFTDICTLIMGQSPDSSSYNTNYEGLPFYQGNSDFGELHPVPRVWCSEPKKIAQENDILISVRAPIGDLNIANEKCCIGRGLAAIRIINSDNVDLTYLYHFFESKRTYLQEKGTGSTFKAINKDSLINFVIPLPSIKEQESISQELFALHLLIKGKKTQLFALDELVKSRFIEMFGYPFTNEKGYPLLTIDDVMSFQGGSQPDKKYFEYIKTDENVRLIQIRDYKTDKFITYIPKSMAKRYCTKEDIMIGRYGPPIFQILQGIEGSYNVALMKAIPKMGNRDFIRYFLKQDCLLEYLQQYCKRVAGQDGIQMDKLKEFPFPYPPIELQNEFAEFVKLIDKSKFVCHSKNFLCDIFTFSSSTIAYPSVVSIFVCPKRC